MNVLVTGGAGFIGWHVCERLCALGHTPQVLDIAGDVPMDVRRPKDVNRAVHLADGVIHLAGVLGTQETIQKPRQAIGTNIDGSVNVFEACVTQNKPCVYICVGNHWMSNPYSISKTCAEKMALMYNKERGGRIAVVRGMNVYGPRQKVLPVRKIIPNFMLSALRGDPIMIYGDGEQRMDMIYVTDIAEILVAALDCGQYSTVIEAGTGVAHTVNEIATHVLLVTGSRGRTEHVPMRPGEDCNSIVVADVSTLAVLGDIKPRPLLIGLPPTMEWYRRGNNAFS